MKTSILSLIAFACLVSTATAQQADPVRNSVNFKVAAPSNQDDEIEAVYVDYTVKNKQYQLICKLWTPTDASLFNGGDVLEEDIDFDGTPDLMVSLGTIDGFGNEVYDGFVWNAKTKQFDEVVNFSEIINPEIKKDLQQIDSYRREDNTLYYERWEWKFGCLGCTYKTTETLIDGAE